MHVVIRNSCVVAGFFFVSVCLAEENFNYETVSNQKCSDPLIIQLVDKAKKEINNRMYLTVATVDENSSPWNAPVYSAFDQKYNFYWMSAITSQHSINIRINSKTFAVIYDSTVAEGTGFGVYIRGNSSELNSSDFDEINHGIAVMGARIHRTDLPPASNYLAPSPEEFINLFLSIFG